MLPLHFCPCLLPVAFQWLPFAFEALPIALYRSGSKGRKEWRYMPASKSYHLHVGIQTDPSLSSNVLPPIDSFTVAIHDALFTGVFLQEAAAKRYISLNKTASPYRSVCSSTVH